jgi:molybdate transport system substrate-binding protein
MMRIAAAILGFLVALALNAGAGAAEIKVLTAGAMKSVVLAIADDFQKATSNTLVVENDTAGGLTKRIEGGASFDVAIITPSAIADLAKKGLIAGEGTPVARVGIGVVVKSGAPIPDITTVASFKRTLLAAKSVAYIDPASGGSQRHLSGPAV